ncbi:hypothetical protein PAXRUDRAFT_173144 [Paxillus rubicundulus Ve08.2h10]|uniref:Uncharacterized protein n=1 Tax=Paxillus rubicundulus Ve08.2h10 TaxID=930991 RepID=A0A0D0BV88_9AGAM|nr:hypothetical protein PAXRUDRAFT_173144 [Paxillus rubicundulus Ve08.2h10]
MTWRLSYLKTLLLILFIVLLGNMVVFSIEILQVLLLFTFPMLLNQMLLLSLLVKALLFSLSKPMPKICLLSENLPFCLLSLPLQTQLFLSSPLFQPAFLLALPPIADAAIPQQPVFQHAVPLTAIAATAVLQLPVEG